MGILNEDAVMISRPEKEDDPAVITVSCPDKTGLGCDLCRIILLFGLSICRGDVSTDGKWCFLLFWVVGRPNTRWNLLKHRLLEVCPSYFSTLEIEYYARQNISSQPPDVFLLKFWCSYDGKGLLHDVTKVLCELELTIKRVKVSTTPDGKVMDLFFVTDSRELLRTKKRQEETIDCLRAVLGDTMMSCEIELIGPEIAATSQGPLFLPSAITEGISSLDLPDGHLSGSLFSKPISVSLDNSLSPSHTLIDIHCQDHKGLLYDIMKTLKDCDIQISYGRFSRHTKGNCEVELFLMQADGRKIVEPAKQNALRSHLSKELQSPLRVAVSSWGPDTVLLVANPVELSGRGRPLVFYDITLALETVNTRIFSVEIGRHMISNREWEVYKFLLDERDCLHVPRQKIEQEVRNTLMGWE